MSFKREGDDGSQLNVLKKRRVADLLASFIPEDEAILLKNGSYACTVCFYRPVFDTLDMLTVHRRGKKHVACLQKHYGKKRELKNQIQKRQHEDFVRAEETGQKLETGPAPLLAQTRKITHHALLKAAPYNSCSGRNRTESRSQGEETPEPLVTPWVTCEPGHSSQLERKPWEPAKRYTQEKSDVRETTSSPAAEERTCTHPLLVGTVGPSGSLGQRPHKTKRKNQQRAAQTDAGDAEKTRAMEHYLQLRSSGWIPDGTGKWIKDEGVEFDSDEEEPPLLQVP
ncbi:sodium channel modifier 1 isoform X1 [Pleurodeles waltl]